MEPGTISAIVLGSFTGLYAGLKGLKNLLGFKKCKCHSNSNDEECVFGCKAIKKIQKPREPERREGDRERSELPLPEPELIAEL